MISNLGYPRRIDYFTHANDSFRRYLLLENLDDTPFDATGYVFDFLVISGTQPQWPFCKQNLSAIVTDEGTYIPIEIEEDVLRKAGNFKTELRATKSGSRYTWLVGSFVVSRTEGMDAIETDIIEINTLTLKVRITLLLEAPDGEVVEPPDSDIFVTSDIWNSSTLC